MTLLRTLYLLLLAFGLLLQGCDKSSPDDCIDCPDGNELGTISISVEGMELTSDQQILVILSKNNDRINHAHMNFDDARARIAKYDSLKVEGDFIETYYTEPGKLSLDIEVEMGEYYTHIFAPNGKKAVEYFALTDERRKDERFTQLFDIGHMIIQVAQSQIFGSEIDSDVVHLYNYTDKLFQELQTATSVEPEVIPTYTSTTATALIQVDGGIRPIRGIAFFYNIPITTYITKAHNKIFAPKGEVNKSVNALDVVHNEIKIYRITYIN